MVNKFAIASIASNYGFVAAVGISLLIEVGVILGAVIWHRNKAVAQDTVMERFFGSAKIEDEDAIVYARRRQGAGR